MNIKNTMIQDQKELSIRNFKFNRFILLRYALALFFFINVYWFIFNLFTKSITAIVPGIVIVCSLAAIGEQIKLFWNHDNALKFTKMFFKVQLAVNIILAVIIWIESVFSFLYPFLTFTNDSLAVVYAILIVGMFVALLLIKKAQSISNNRDKKYKLIKKYEKSLVRESDKNVRAK